MADDNRQRLAAEAARALAGRDAARAEGLLADLSASAGRTLQVLKLEHRLRGLRGDRAAQVAIATEALRRFPDKLPAHRLAVEAHAAAADWSAAMAAAVVALRHFPADPHLLKRGVSIARRLGRNDEAIHWMKRLIQEGRDQGRWMGEIGKMLTASFQAEEGLRYLRSALRYGASEQNLRLYLAMACERTGNLPEAAEYWSAIAETETSERFRARARKALRRIDRGSTSPRGTIESVDGLEALSAFGGRPRARPGPIATYGGDITGWRTPGSRSAILFFGGIAPMMGAVRPTVPPAVRARGLNGLSFADPRRVMTLKGLPSLGADYPETLAALRALLAAWGVEHTYVIGMSAGGYPALRYGIDLGVRRILLLSPGTTPPDTDSPLVTRLRQQLGDMAVDIAEYVRAHGRNVPVIAAYGADNADDAWQAERLAGLPNVDLRPVPGVAAHLVAVHEDVEALYDALLA